MPKLCGFLKFWLPVILWMALIFSASGDSKSFQHSSTLFEPLMRWLFPWMSQEWISHIHYLFRKCAHLTEYAVLALLLWRAIHKPSRGIERPWQWSEARLALLIVAAYAATDELHQSFTPSRNGQVADVLVDTAGGAIGLTLLRLGRKIRRRKQK